MMQYDHILIRYGEMSLKGKNRSFFIDTLKDNIKQKIRAYPDVKIVKTRSRMFIELNGQDPEPIIEQIKTVFGIQSFSLAYKTTWNLEDIQKVALKIVQEAKNVKTFKVSAKRANKSFPIGSQELNHLVGSYVLINTEDITVDVHHPDLELKVEVRDNSVYLSSQNQLGAGGLPVGTSGKAMLMLSGGIDSPVAAYLTMKRGVRIEAIHFHSPPFTSERAKQKVIDLAKVLTNYGSKMKVHIVPFTEIQQLIHKEIPASYTMTAMRRMMLRIAEKIAQKNNALAIATGESLGQVASQTLDSMNTINEVTNYPIIRPLITMDKLDIIKIAEEIGTFPISIRPYEDCCTIFLPKSPTTKPKRDKINHFESKIEWDEYIQKAVDETESLFFKANHATTAFTEEEYSNLF